MKCKSICILVTDVKLCHPLCDRNCRRHSCSCHCVVLTFECRSDASLTGGAICRSTGVTIRGLGASKVAQTQRTVETTCHAVQGVRSVPSCWFSPVTHHRCQATPLGVPCLSPLQPTPCDPLTSFELCGMQKGLVC